MPSRFWQGQDVEDAPRAAAWLNELEAQAYGGSQTPIVTNLNGLRRWRVALGDALLGTAVVTVIGDSISVGVGSDGSSTGGGTTVGASTYRKASWDAQLRSLFAKTYGDPGECWVGYNANNTAGDFAGRITLAGGASGGGYGPNQQGVKATANTHTITLTTLDATCTQVDFYTWDGGSGTASWAVDGGSATTFSAGGGSTGSLTWTKRSITGLTAGTHTVVITGPSTGLGVYVAGFDVWAGTVGVRVHCMAFSGDTSNNPLGFDSAYNSNAGAKNRSLAAIGLVPLSDLVVVALGVNDFGGQNTTDPATYVQPGTTPTQYASNIQAIVNQAVTNGACVLLVGEPRQNAVNYPSPMTYAEDDYYAQAKAIAAATDHCAFIDVGEVWGSNVTGQTLGLYTTNSVHPKRKGHGDIARIVFDVLTRKYETAVAA